MTAQIGLKVVHFPVFQRFFANSFIYFKSFGNFILEFYIKLIFYNHFCLILIILKVFKNLRETSELFKACTANLLYN